RGRRGRQTLPWTCAGGQGWPGKDLAGSTLAGAGGSRDRTLTSKSERPRRGDRGPAGKSAAGRIRKVLATTGSSTKGRVNDRQRHDAQVEKGRSNDRQQHDDQGEPPYPAIAADEPTPFRMPPSMGMTRSVHVFRQPNPADSG